jgi:hypothetical protein
MTEISAPKDILAFEASIVTQYVERWINEGLEKMTDSEAEKHYPSHDDRGNLSLTTKVTDTTLTPRLSSCSQPASSNIPIKHMEKKFKDLPKGPETNDFNIFWKEHLIMKAFLDQQPTNSPIKRLPEMLLSHNSIQGKANYPQRRWEWDQSPQMIPFEDPGHYQISFEDPILKHHFAMNRRLLTYGRAKSMAGAIIKKQIQSISRYINRQTNMPGGEVLESILRDMANKHPKYSQIIRALPVLLNYIPEKVKKDLMRKEHLEIMKIGVIIVKHWGLSKHAIDQK